MHGHGLDVGYSSILLPRIIPKIIAAKDRKELEKVAFLAPPHGFYLMCVS
jgi:tRNA pseudouridine38-40 synthase